MLEKTNPYKFKRDPTIYTLELIDANGCSFHSSGLWSVSVQQPIGIESFNVFESIKIQSNVIESEILLDYSVGIDVVSINLYSESGQLIKKYNPKSKSLDCLNISKGLYLLRIKTQTGFFTEKTLKL